MASNFRYTREQIEFLHQGFMQMSVTQLAVKFNAHYGLDKSPATIASTLKNRGIKSGRKGGTMSKGRPRTFTPQQKQWCIDNYPLLSRKDLTAEFNKVFNENRRLSQLVAFLKNHNIKSGRDGLFQPGRKSWNDGTKGVMKPNATSFKPGSLPHNHKPVGSERIVEGGYIEVKVAEPQTWVPKARMIWEAQNGPIPAGHNVRFKDANPANLALSNLFVVSNAEHQILNNAKFKEQLPEHKDTVILIARIRAKSNEVMRSQA